jgi:hypothetical protein
MRQPVQPHFARLMGANVQIAARPGPAEQHKASLLVLREKRIGRRLIHFAFQQYFAASAKKSVRL